MENMTQENEKHMSHEMNHEAQSCCSSEGKMPNEHSEKRAYAEKLKAQIDEWDADIAKLEARASQVAADARAGYEQRIESLKKSRELLRERMEEISESSGESWEALKDGISGAWNSLKEGITNAKNAFH